MTNPSRSKRPATTKTVVVQGKKRKPPGKVSPENFIIEWWPEILLAISALIVLQARLKLLAIPMERDEAGFAYIGHWLFKGRNLYTDVVDNKLPGLYILYGLFTSVFGYNATGVHIGLMLSNVLAALFFFLILKHNFNRYIAATATAFFLVLLAGPNMLGFAAHATQLLLPFVLGGFYLFWNGISSGRKSLFLISGLLLGLAFIIKQQSVVFGVLAALIWWPVRFIWNKKEGAKIPFLEWVLLGIGGLLPVLTVIFYFKITGRLDDLIFWSVKQPSRMSATFINTRMELFMHFVPIVSRHIEAICITASAGLVLIFLSGFKKEITWFGFLLFCLGLGSVSIGAAFYQHYFVLALPGIALLVAAVLYWISEKIKKGGTWISLGLGIFLISYTVIRDREYFFQPDYNKIHQEMYSINMFPELERIGTELNRRAPKGSHIGVMGSEPEVLVAADREGCSKHLFMYPILSDPELSPPMQEEYLNDMLTCMPDYIVWNVGVFSWAAEYDKLTMFRDLMKWVDEHYTTSAIAELRKDQPGEIVWDRDVVNFQSQNDFKVYVFKKK